MSTYKGTKEHAKKLFVYLTSITDGYIRNIISTMDMLGLTRTTWYKAMEFLKNNDIIVLGSKFKLNGDMCLPFTLDFEKGMSVFDNVVVPKNESKETRTRDSLMDTLSQIDLLVDKLIEKINSVDSIRQELTSLKDEIRRERLRNATLQSKLDSLRMKLYGATSDI